MNFVKALSSWITAELGEGAFTFSKVADAGLSRNLLSYAKYVGSIPTLGAILFLMGCVNQPIIRANIHTSCGDWHATPGILCVGKDFKCGFILNAGCYRHREYPDHITKNRFPGWGR